MGEAELALDHLHRGLRFHPRDSWAQDSWGGVATALIQLRRDEEALAAARTAVQLNPRFSSAVRILAAALALTGRLDEAKDMMRQHLEIDPRCTISAMKARFGFTEKAAARYFEGMRKAGLPE
jgi:adenylate cyclase